MVEVKDRSLVPPHSIFLKMRDHEKNRMKKGGRIAERVQTGHPGEKNNYPEDSTGHFSTRGKKVNQTEGRRKQGKGGVN